MTNRDPHLASRQGNPATPKPRPAKRGEVLERTNELVNACSRAWLLAAGLATSIRAVAGTEIETPGLDELFVEARAAAQAVAEFGEAIIADYRSFETLGTGARQQADAVQRSCRALAQLAMGVTSFAGWDSDTMLLERAAVVVVAESEVAVADDLGTSLRATDVTGLQVEVAGLICRMLLGRPRTEELGCGGGPMITIAAGAGCGVIVARGAEQWEWSDPVTVLEPATLAANLLVANLLVGAAHEPAGPTRTGSVDAMPS
jgi:hypothetical protein